MNQNTSWAELQKARKNFFNNTGHPEEVVRQEVYDSWVRSRSYKLDLDDEKPHILSTPELKERINRNRYLYDTTTSFMEYLYQIVQGSGFILMFADRDGYVLQSIGDHDIIDIARRQDIPLVVGSCRQESVVGTNAIGTPLCTGKPIQLNSYEHYFELSANWTCSGAPIIMNGRTLGVICISGSWKNAHTHTLGMVMSAAEAISRQCSLMETNDHLTSMRNQLQTSLDSIHNGVLLLDAAYNITFINAITARELNLDKEDILNHSYSEFFPELDLFHQTHSIYNIETTALGQDGPFKCYATVKRVATSSFSNRESFLISFSKPEYIQQIASRLVSSNARYTFKNIIGECTLIKRLKSLAQQAAKGSMNILITGESGTGKEMFAQSIHNLSPMSKGPFVTINCGAIPKDQIAGELFGSVDKQTLEDHAGKLELADGGTLFIDEIGEMPYDVQSQLLSVLQSGEVRRIGSAVSIPINVRYIAATNTDLEHSLRNRTFNSDLYYRLNVFSLHIPPLRDRGDDIMLLVKSFIRKYSDPKYAPIVEVVKDVEDVFKTYSWPGNIRELENVMERACILTTNGIMTLEALPSSLIASARRAESAEITPSISGAERSSSKTGDALTASEAEKILIIDHLTRAGGNIRQASETLGISRRTLYRKLERYGIDPNKIRFISK